VAGGEFSFIARHFGPLAGPEALGLKDDAAVLAPTPGQDLILSADTLVENVHFFSDDAPDLIARKALRCNLSDLAGMGARPRGYLLTIARPNAVPDSWFARFANGLATDQEQFGLSLLGGDTTASRGGLVLTITILGEVPHGRAIRRDGARAGDDIWVTGTIGDGALGLLARQGGVPDPDHYLTGRYLLPQPRLGLALAGIASSAMDISDGLVQDAGHIAQASQVSLTIRTAAVPASDQARALRNVLADRWLPLCLSGGDDYELLLTCPPDHSDAIRQAASSARFAITRIGSVSQGKPGVELLDEQGRRFSLSQAGWQHF